jgi:hypothetical protein
LPYETNLQLSWINVLNEVTQLVFYLSIYTLEKIIYLSYYGVNNNTT